MAQPPWPLSDPQSSVIQFRLCVLLHTRSLFDMVRLQIFQRWWCILLFIAGILSMVIAMTLAEPSPASAGTAKNSKKSATPAEVTAQRYAEAMGAGNKVRVTQLDFACRSEERRVGK